MGNQLGKFDHLFKNIIPNSVGGIKIFSEKDSYKITQQYDSVTKLENKLWSNLYQIQAWFDKYFQTFFSLLLKIEVNPLKT